MMKFISALMVAAMLSNTGVTASHATTTTTPNNEMIARTFNEFRYQMTADPNANDPSFQSRAVAEFKLRLASLQKQGVHPLEMMDYMRNTILDANARKDFDRMLSTMDSNISSEEAGNLAMKFMADRYQKGASFRGGGGQAPSYRKAMIIVGVVIVGVVTYLIIKHKRDCKSKTVTDTKTDTKTDTVTDTKTDTVTDTKTNTVTDTKTNTVTQTGTVTNTVTQTGTVTNTVTHTGTVTNTVTQTGTVTHTGTVTNTVTHTVTSTDLSFGFCCNIHSGNIVPASPTGCEHGVALYFVPSPELCVGDTPHGN